MTALTCVKCHSISSWAQRPGEPFVRRHLEHTALTHHQHIPSHSARITHSAHTTTTALSQSEISMLNYAAVSAMWVTLPSLLVSATANTCHCIQCRCRPIELTGLQCKEYRGAGICQHAAVQGTEVWREHCVILCEGVASSSLSSRFQSSKRSHPRGFAPVSLAARTLAYLERALSWRGGGSSESLGQGARSTLYATCYKQCTEFGGFAQALLHSELTDTPTRWHSCL